MDFASLSRAAENRTRWKGIVSKSSVVPQRPSKVTLEKNRIVLLIKLFKLIKIKPH